jgi:hypothetical protein
MFECDAHYIGSVRAGMNSNTIVVQTPAGNTYMFFEKVL